MFGGELRAVLQRQGAKESATVEPFFSLQLDIQVGREAGRETKEGGRRELQVWFVSLAVREGVECEGCHGSAGYQGNSKYEQRQLRGESRFA